MDRTKSLLLAMVMLCRGSSSPSLSLSRVSTLLSSRLIRSWRMQLAWVLAQVRTGCPGMKIRLSIAPLRHPSNLYRILLASRSHRTTLPSSSALAIHAASLLNDSTFAGSFCRTENTFWSLRKFTNIITPFCRAIATISTRGEA